MNYDCENTDDFIKGYRDAEAFLVELLKNKPVKDTTISSEIAKFIDVGELEMAFEIAMLSAMDEAMSFTPDEKKTILRHSQLLKLDIDNVYDDNFWEKLNNYLRA